MKDAKQLEGWDVGHDFEIIKLLGSGSYGSVAEAIHKPTKTRVAIKKVISLFDDKVDCKRVLREINLLRNMNHSHVVKLFDVLEPADPKHFNSIYLVMEYAQSDIKKLVKSAIHLQKIHVQKIIYNMLVGLKYIHSGNVLHRDIKPANILINEDCSVKICDFGLARSFANVVTAAGAVLASPKSAEELKTDSSDEDIKIKNSKLAPISPSSLDNEVPEKKKQEIQNQLKRTQGLRRSMKRQLTGHVVTRWYRAPEIILLEKDYGAAVDVWSVGCIFAELLSMIKENAPTYSDRSPLFPGKSCFPLSPDHKVTAKKGGYPTTHTDQLNVIFDVIGTPTEEEMVFVTDPKAVEYLKTFTPRKRTDLKKKYPAAGDDAIDLLNKMLVFNPFFRISIQDCLDHPFLESTREKASEKTRETEIELMFENEKDLTERRLRELFLEEVNYYKKKRSEGKIVYK